MSTRERRPSGIYALIAAAILPACGDATAVGADQAVPGTVVTTEAEGIGATPEDALKYALKVALRRGNGLSSINETRIVDGRIVYDRKTSLVEGRVQTFTILEQWEEKAVYRCRIRATVRRGVTESPSAKIAGTVAAVDGAALFATAVGTHDSLGEGRDYVGTALIQIPLKAGRLQLSGPLRITEVTNHEVVLSQELQLIIDPAAYAGAQRQLTAILDRIAEERGIFVAESTLISGSRPGEAGRCFAASFVHSEAATLDARCDPLRRLSSVKITRPPSAAWTPKNHGADQLLVVVQISGAGDTRSGVWRWYRIARPANFALPATSAILTLRGNGAEVVVRDEFSLGPSLPGLSLADAAGSDRQMQSVIIAPALTHHVGAGYCYEKVELSRSVVFTRRISVPIDQLQHVRLVTCELNTSGTPDDSLVRNP